MKEDRLTFMIPFSRARARGGGRREEEEEEGRGFSTRSTLISPRSNQKEGRVGRVKERRED